MRVALAWWCACGAQVFPLLRSLVPNAELVLVGAEIWVEFAKNHEGVQPHGVVSELMPFLRKVGARMPARRPQGPKAGMQIGYAPLTQTDSH